MLYDAPRAVWIGDDSLNLAQAHLTLALAASSSPPPAPIVSPNIVYNMIYIPYNIQYCVQYPIQRTMLCTISHTRFLNIDSHDLYI